MPATTSKGIVYPLGNDSAAALHTVFASLASSIDAVLSGYVTSAGGVATSADVATGTNNTKLVTPKTLKDSGIKNGDTGWVDISSTVTASSGFKKGTGFSVKVRRVGDVVSIRGVLIQKASGSPTLRIGVTGNVANTIILTGIPAAYRPTETQPLMAGQGGRNNAYFIGSSGSVGVASMTPAANQTSTVNCPTNEEFSFGGTYFIN